MHARIALQLRPGLIYSWHNVTAIRAITSLPYSIAFIPSIPRTILICPKW